MSVTCAYDPGPKTLVYEDKGSRVFVTQEYMPFQAGFQPRYVSLPWSWKYGQLYIAGWGVTWSGEIGVPIFSKFIVDGEVWWLWRKETTAEGGTFHFHYYAGRRMPNRTVGVRIELGRTVNGEDIVDVLYEGSTISNGKSGQGVGYPVRILAWDFKPQLYTGEFYGDWFMLVRKAEVGVSNFLILRDLDSGELLWQSAENIGQGFEMPFFYGRLLDPPYGERHLRFSFESPAGEVYDYFDMNVTLSTIPFPPPATLQGTVTDAKTGAPIGGASITCDSYAAVTDAAGFYKIFNIPAQVYTVKAVKVGHQVTTIDVDLSAGGPFSLDISLTPDVMPLLPAIGSTVTGVVLIALSLG